MLAASNSSAYHWHKFHKTIPEDAVYAGKHYVAIKAHHNGDWVVGKLHADSLQAYIPLGGKEVEVTSEIEILVHSPGATVEWVSAKGGHVPDGAVGPIGSEQLYVGRTVCPAPENTFTPGKIHPGNKTLYIPFDGKESEYPNYEACVIKGGAPVSPTNWESFNGQIPNNAVKASNEYVVIRAKHGNDWVPGKLSTKELKAYIPYDSKEVHVSSGIEVLTHSESVQPRWIPSSNGQQPPPGSVGPIGEEGVYIGRAVCPQPESVQTPGKVHLQNKCLYIPFGGAEEKVTDYEVLVITRNH